MHGLYELIWASGSNTSTRKSECTERSERGRTAEVSLAFEMRCAYLIVAASLLSGAQNLQIGTIEFFGLRKIPAERIRSVLGVREGDSIVPSDSWGKSVRRRIGAIPGISRVHVNLGCCDPAGKATVTIGIVEKGVPVMAFRAAPALPVRLPKEINGTYRRCMDAWEQAIRVGDNQDNVEEGHSLMANSEVRAIQLRFIPLARKHLEVLRRVLRDSAYDEHRAAAAWVLGYASDKAPVVSDLVYASGDPNELVRNNAMRSLWAIASLSTSKPELGIHIPCDPFIDLLNSIVSTDRNKAVAVLGVITLNRPPDIMYSLRSRALPVLAQMARKPDGFGSYLLIGRMAGLAENKITESWKSEEGESVILGVLRGGPQE